MTVLTLEKSATISRGSTSVGVLPSLVQSIQAHFDKQFKVLLDKVDDGFSRCEKKLKVLDDKVDSIKQPMEAVKEGKEEAEQTKSNLPTPAAHVEETATDPDDGNKAVTDVGSKFMNKETLKENGQSASVNGAHPSVMVVENKKQPVNYVALEKAKQEEKRKAAITRAKSERLKKSAPTQKSPFFGNRTAKCTVGKGYDPFAPVA
ncbi:unnamed protein product [Arabis nemorensis]|uniref:Uncharacterized protein n=1 Tax=Arabis nemorensis TaxID=586526 RepID=A0A565BT36_9BRAS|nr:unnamed protein product [Arabis nemorensis]